MADAMNTIAEINRMIDEAIARKDGKALSILSAELDRILQSL